MAGVEAKKERKMKSIKNLTLIFAVATASVSCLYAQCVSTYDCNSQYVQVGEYCIGTGSGTKSGGENTYWLAGGDPCGELFVFGLPSGQPCGGSPPITECA